ncbi:MAG: hypothetical protein HY721_19265 [Planctomycetes bacterium]|nr:hypothetical protein [Planctomycetota bacterium]
MLQIFWILIASAAALAAIAFSSWIPAVVTGVLVVAGAGWVLVSTLSPAVPDRRCPRCGELGLVKIRRGRPGVRCERCGWRDEEMHVAHLDAW